MAARSLEYQIRDASIRVVNWNNLRRMDWMIIGCVLLLALAGFLTLYSACRSMEIELLYRQIGGFLIGTVLAVCLTAVDYRFLVSFAPLAYGISVLLLLAVELTGYMAGGSERWLELGPIRIQPSEMTKLVMVFMLTWYFHVLGRRIRKLHWFILTFVIVGVPTLLILAQPNLGTAATMAPLTLAMLWVAGCRMWHLAAVVLVGLSIFPVVYLEMKDFDPEAAPFGTVTDNPEAKVNPKSMLGLKDYQKKRIYAFLHPDYDPKGSGWHTTQSKITIGSGGLSGKGYLQGTQTRLNYLPEHHTDFIFSLLGEEQGFIGVCIVIALFAAFLFRGLMFARDCPEMQGTLLATGIVTVLAFHIFVNIAVTVGVMPVTGIPLPFLSYGRSFYITVMACVGVLLSIPARPHMRFVHRKGVS
ncbi:MAG: rod shape-determining protein RodA [Candidatus Hydrogenedens sp.]|nr:rod shape-determining protein RodA [Candidatus Hydrogenedens sp.]